MSYDTSGIRNVYNFSGVNNAASAALGAIRVPAGCRFAAIDDISAGVAAAIVGTTAAGLIQIGTVATIAKYAAQAVGPLTGLPNVGSAYGSQDLDGRVAAYNPGLAPSATQKGRIDLMQDGDTPGVLQTALRVSNAAATGTPAGTYNVTITVRFW
jgi:hypothetical protein